MNLISSLRKMILSGFIKVKVKKCGKNPSVNYWSTIPKNAKLGDNVWIGDRVTIL